MRLLLTLFVLSFSFANCFALTGDTIHVKKYSISIDTLNYSDSTFSARTTLNVESRLNGVNNITLSLLDLTIDSITSGNQALAYTYDDTLIRITPPTTLNLNDTIIITVAYHGHPQRESYFGGFYFTGVYAFNIGVAFGADPHSYGRAWFPCIDEFTDKGLYDFHIVTPSTYKAFCNGSLDSTVNNGNGTTTWSWSIHQPIQPYLACVAVAPFCTVERTYQSIPVEIGCLPADSGKTMGTFRHLDSCLMFFINAYGAYPWNKVGYICVPFSAGGMEHATSIHIGANFFDSTLTYETLWAHELAHMWWGDKVTCATEEDMWLNEGMAVSNEHLFTEVFYGTQAYKDAIRSNHRLVLQFSHVRDSGYYALNAVPHAYTYGRTVYLKGADIVHTLRKFMGDTAFFTGCRAYLNNLAYSNATSADFRDQLSNATSIGLNTFFNDWVFTPGFPHFSVDSFTVTPNGGQYDVTIYTRQKQKGNTHIYSTPVECTLSDGVNDTTVTMLINATTNIFSYALSFSPIRTTIDKDDKMADAIIADEQSLNATGIFSFIEPNVRVIVKNVGAGPSMVRVEHHFVAPDNFKVNPGILVSDYHYYRVDGTLQNGFVAGGTFFYNGSQSTTSGYLDNTLITGKEDSLVLLYRSGAGDDWHIAKNYVLGTGGNHTDKTGNITIDTLQKGEYCFGYRKHSLGIAELKAQTSGLSASPNPAAADGCTLNFQLPYGQKGKIEIVNELGQVVYSTQVFSHQQFVKWDTYNCKAGIYSAAVYIDNRKTDSANIVVVH